MNKKKFYKIKLLNRKISRICKNVSFSLNLNEAWSDSNNHRVCVLFWSNHLSSTFVTEVLLPTTSEPNGKIIYLDTKTYTHKKRPFDRDCIRQFPIVHRFHIHETDNLSGRIASNIRIQQGKKCTRCTCTAHAQRLNQFKSIKPTLNWISTFKLCS